MARVLTLDRSDISASATSGNGANIKHISADAFTGRGGRIQTNARILGLQSQSQMLTNRSNARKTKNLPV